MFIKHRAHCGRLWVVEVEGKVQVTLEAKLINILIWKLCFFQLIFILFLAGVEKSSAFCTLWLLYSKVEIFKLRFDTKKVIPNSTFDFLRFYRDRVKFRKLCIFFNEFWWNGNVQIATVCALANIAPPKLVCQMTYFSP